MKTNHILKSLVILSMCLLFSNFSLGFTITASAGPNGSINPAGTITVNAGDDITFTITPNACYQSEDVMVDGNSVGQVTSYTFTNVNADHTIEASFEAAIVVSVQAGVIACYNGTTCVTVTASGGTPPYTGASVICGQGAGSYTYNVTDANGCQASGSVTITQPSHLNVTLAVNNSSPPCCPTALVTGGTPPYSYSWTGPNSFVSNLQDPPCPPALSNGTYLLMATDVNGCTANGNVQVNCIEFTATAAVTQPSCQGVCDATITLNVTGSGNYFYQFDCNGPQIPFSTSPLLLTGICPPVTTICVGDSILNSANTLSVGVVVPNPLPLSVSLTVDPDCCPHITASGGCGPYIFVWHYPNGSTYSGQNIPCPLPNGHYSVDVTDASGQTVTKTFDIDCGCWKCDTCVTEQNPTEQVDLGDLYCPLVDACSDGPKPQLDVNNLAPGNLNDPFISITRKDTNDISGTVFRTRNNNNAVDEWSIITKGSSVSSQTSDFEIRNGGITGDDINPGCGISAIHINKNNVFITQGSHQPYGKNYVGIGTDDPHADVHIASQANFDFNHLLRLERKKGLRNSLDFIISSNPVGSSQTIGLGSYSLVLDNNPPNQTGGDMAFSTHGAQIDPVTNFINGPDGSIDLIIKCSHPNNTTNPGFVGINELNPQQRLDVNGRLRVQNIPTGRHDFIVTGDNSSTANGGVLTRIDFNGTGGDYLGGDGLWHVERGGGGGGNNFCGTPYRIHRDNDLGTGTECSQIYDNGIPGSNGVGGSIGGVAVGNLYTKTAIQPIDQFQVDGDVRIGRTDLNGSNTGSSFMNYQLTANYGNRLHFSGATNHATFDRDNEDPMWMARYYKQDEQSQLRVNIGNDLSPFNENNEHIDLFNIGTTVSPDATTNDESWATHFVVTSEGNTGIGGKIQAIANTTSYPGTDVFNNHIRPVRRLEVMSEDPNLVTDPNSDHDPYASIPNSISQLGPFPQVRITSFRSDHKGDGLHTDLGTNGAGDFYIVPENRTSPTVVEAQRVGILTKNPGNTLTVGYNQGSNNHILSGLRLNALAVTSPGRQVFGNPDNLALSVNSDGDVYLKQLDYGHGNVSNNCGQTCGSQVDFLPVATNPDGTSICKSIVYDDNAVANPCNTNNNRRIGINTTTPAAKLDVQLRETPGPPDYPAGNFVIDRYNFGPNILNTVPSAVNAEYRTNNNPYNAIRGINSYIPLTNSFSTEGIVSEVSVSPTSTNATIINGLRSTVNASSGAVGFTANSTGIRGEVIGLGSTHWGGFFSTDGLASANNYGIQAIAPIDGTDPLKNLAGLFDGNVRVNGDVYQNTTKVISDSSLKEHIRTIANPLSLVNSLHPLKYNFRTAQHPELNLDSGDQFGFISQEIAQVAPELVQEVAIPTRDSNNNVVSTAHYKFLNYTGIIPIAVAGIQQLDSIVNHLKDSSVSRSCNLQNNYIPKATGANSICNSRIYDNGVGVAIGTNVIPAGYGFIVDSLKAGFREVIVVCPDSAWPDYVFDKKYSLEHLDELENFVSTNKHLPGIPSSSQIKKGGGINVGEMQTRQMEKIEELYQYLILMNKNVAKLNAENKELKAEIEKMNTK